MTTEMWVVVVAVAVLWLAINDISRRVQRTNKLLEVIVDQLVFANQGKRDIERREKYPNLPD